MDDSQGEGFGRLNPDGDRAAYPSNSADIAYLAAEYQQPNHKIIMFAPSDEILLRAFVFRFA